jgi:hypothetical protein
MNTQLDIEAIQKAVVSSALSLQHTHPDNHGTRVQIAILCDIAQSLRRIAHILEEKSK